eukprot:EG_transcript_12141
MPLPRGAPALLLGLLAATLFLGPAAAAGCDPALARRVQASIGHLTVATACFENVWLRDFLLSDSRRGIDRTAVVVDVGCNKGFDALNALNLFRQAVVVSGPQWRNATRFPCGHCGQCAGVDQPAVPGAHGRPTLVYCIEPLPANFERLSDSAQRLDLGQHGFHTVHAAATSEEDARARNWTAKFPVVSAKAHRRDKRPAQLAGREGVGLDVNKACPLCDTVEVPLLVVDQFVELHQLAVIDYLSIDTEGNDPNVMFGANRSLSRVRYLEFEYHHKAKWSRTSLRDVVHWLRARGLVCYWIGKGKVWRLTDCWHDAYHKHGWSNVGCVQTREAEWYAILEGYFNRTVPH